jgi:fluoride ion exporter CrcB/FEX
MPWLGDGLPWGFIFFWAAAALGLGLAAELSMRRLQWAEQTQVLIMIALLGTVATVSTLFLALKLPQIGGGWRGGLPGLFALNALGTALTAWVGMLLGRQA